MRRDSVYVPVPTRSVRIRVSGDPLGLDPWFLAITDGGYLEFVVADESNKASVVRSPYPLPTGRWLHVAGVLEDQAGRQTLLANGHRVAGTRTKIRAAGPLSGPAPGIGIGNRQAPSHQAFCGLIDEVRITAEPLSPAELLPSPESE